MLAVVAYTLLYIRTVWKTVAENKQSTLAWQTINDIGWRKRSSQTKLKASSQDVTEMERKLYESASKGPCYQLLTCSLNHWHQTSNYEMNFLWRQTGNSSG